MAGAEDAVDAKAQACVTYAKIFAQHDGRGAVVEAAKADLVAAVGAGVAESAQARPIHWSPYDRVGVVNAVPQGLSPSSLSVQGPSLSIPVLDAFQLQLTPFNSTPTFARMERPRSRTRTRSPGTSGSGSSC